MQLYFFLTNDGKQVGPVAGEELLSHGISHLTLVWGQNMTGWAPAETVDELKPLFAKAEPTPNPNAEPKPDVEAIPITAKTIDAKTEWVKETTILAPEVESDEAEEVSEENGGKGWKYLSFVLMVAVAALAVLYFTKSSEKYNVNSISDYIVQLEAENDALTEKVTNLQVENDTLTIANDNLIEANRNLRQSQGGGRDVVYETPAAVQQELEQLRARNRQLEAQMRRYQESLPD